MAKRVFFSFDYDDVKSFRVNVVRKHDFTKDDIQDAGFFDASIWEEAKIDGPTAIKRLINANIKNTTVTCALIGSDTWSRRWVRYEILKSYDRGNYLLGVHINGIRDKELKTYSNGLNPYDLLGFVVSDDGKELTYYERDGDNWKLYEDLPPKSINYDREHWGRGFKLSSWGHRFWLLPKLMHQRIRHLEYRLW